MKRALVIVLLGLISAFASASAVRAHFSGGDHPSYMSTWYTGGSIPSGWSDALVNGVLVWDNVSSQCHDFQRVSGSGQILHMREYQDGAGNQYAFATWEHDRVSYDSSETWHLNVNVTPGSSSVDLWSTSAHENGHILSLVHSGTSGDTMYPYWNYGDYYLRTLTANDQFRERSIYPGC